MKKKNNLVDWCIENNKEYLLREWDTERNREELDLGVEDAKYGSGKKVWWLCKEGHSWYSTISSRVKGSGCPVCIGRKVLKGYNDLTTTNPNLCKEWHPSKNKIAPEEVSKGSNKRVWWLCEKGHEWQAVINDRNSGTNCPYCFNNGTSFIEQYLFYVLKIKFSKVSNREIIDSLEYDISIKDTDLNLLVEYDGYYYHRKLKNNKSKELEKENRAKELGYDFIRVKEVRKVVKKIEIDDLNIIRCKNKNSIGDLNKVIEVIIDYINNKYNLNIDTTIPADAEQKAKELSAREQYEKSIEVTHPELCEGWDYVKNKNLKPSQFSYGSKKKVWWLCKEGHSWDATIGTKVKGYGCPYCSGRKAIKGETDLATTNPELLKEWDYNKNKINPYEVSAGSNRKVFWKCKLGHSWGAQIYNRVKLGNSCPYCSNSKVLKGYNDLATTHPEKLKEWDYKKNKLRPEEVTAGSGKKVFWVCKEGHNWEAQIASRLNGAGCPHCYNEMRKLG